MGLRLINNVPVQRSLYQLERKNRAQAQSVERMATGDAIVRSAYNPSGLVMSEVLRSQIGSIEQARDNSEFALNVSNTADAALGEIQSLLIDIRESLVFAMNEGATTPEQLESEQNAVDAAIRSIQRIADTTRFGDNNLLNGASELTIGSKSTAISAAKVRSVKLNGAASRTFEIDITAAAERAAIITQFDTSNGTASGDHVIQVTGAVGTQELLLSSGMTTQEMMNLINTVRDQTGVFATLSSGILGTPGAGDSIVLQSDEYGSTQSISLTMKSGSNLYAAQEATGTPAVMSTGQTIADSGQDISASMTGFRIQTAGNRITVSDDQLNASLTIADGTGPTGGTPLSMTVLDSGFTFQLNIGVSSFDSITVGLDNMSPTTLGAPTRNVGGTGAGTNYALDTFGGYLSTLLSGGTNDLTNDPANAMEILDQTIADVNDLRSFLGALDEKVISANLNSLGLAFENLSAGESEVRDLDYAQESSELTRAIINSRSATEILNLGNFAPRQVLTLLEPR